MVVFDTSKRMAKAYVCYLGCARVANNGGPVEDIFVDEDGGDQGADAEGLNIEPDEEVFDDEHEEAPTPLVVYTQGCTLTDDEVSKLGLVLTIKDGYIGSPFVHRLTATNITNKQMVNVILPNVFYCFIHFIFSCLICFFCVMCIVIM